MRADDTFSRLFLSLQTVAASDARPARVVGVSGPTATDR